MFFFRPKFSFYIEMAILLLYSEIVSPGRIRVIQPAQYIILYAHIVINYNATIVLQSDRRRRNIISEREGDLFVRVFKNTYNCWFFFLFVIRAKHQTEKM